MTDTQTPKSRTIPPKRDHHPSSSHHRKPSPTRKDSTKSHPAKRSDSTRHPRPPVRSNTLPTLPLPRNDPVDVTRHRSRHHHPRSPDYDRGELGPYIPRPELPRRSHTNPIPRSKPSSKPAPVRSNTVPHLPAQPPPHPPRPQLDVYPIPLPPGSDVGYVVIPSGIKSGFMVRVACYLHSIDGLTCHRCHVGGDPTRTRSSSASLGTSWVRIPVQGGAVGKLGESNQPVLIYLYLCVTRKSK